MTRFYITVVSWMFGIGMIGCTFVLLMTFWEDLLTILGHEERHAMKPVPRPDEDHPQSQVARRF
jgi:hypothetical protein